MLNVYTFINVLSTLINVLVKKRKKYIKKEKKSMQHQMMTLEHYLEHFAGIIRSKYIKFPMRARYDLDDIIQEAMLKIVEAYPRVSRRIKSGENINPKAIFGAIVFGAIKNYYIRNGFVMSGKCWSTWKINKDAFMNYYNQHIQLSEVENFVNPSGATMAPSEVEAIDLRLDIEDFCKTHDPVGIIRRKLEGQRLVDIADDTGIPYKKVERLHRNLRRKLLHFLAQ